MALWPFGAHDREHPSLGTILVIDDEDSVRKISRLTLTKAGYEVLEAANGEEAIQAINTGENPLTVDVILCDIHMPKINGVEVIHYFQTQYPSVQIVVQTGFPDLNLAMSLMKQGVVDYLVKPVEKEKLLAAVSKAIEQRTICNT